ncbi:hypothetical protein LAZ67_21000209 [Cordylochernes scorpioides]|uniref:Retrovirus-related Pol polyprotein from transposon TNT 1-94 n=1 Tax=Cordylochernes scorpioides TaxID=51811 RepID=A0ABY6LL65_9ARAC|nr:hypothetical protein LAZ67_21000209 [Cordylochernes scorpioides]
MIKHTKQLIVPILVKLFQKCLDLNYYPNEWKKSEVIIIPKPGKTDMKIYKSYRPICLNSNISKIFEKIINNKLLKFYEDSNLLNNRQHGFRRSRSTISALNEIVKIALEHKNKEYTAIIAVDISGAFDNAWWPMVLKRLDEDNVQASIIKLLQYFFNNRRVRFRYSSNETHKKLSKGCPQGGPISPTIWNIILNDLLNNYSESNSEIIAYADDLTVICWGNNLTELRNTTGKVMGRILDWCGNNKLTASEEKTKILYLFNSKIAAKIPNTITANRVEKLKIMGITFKNHRNKNKLDFVPHIDEIITKTNRASGYLIGLTGKAWGLDSKRRIELYKTLFRSSLTYGSTIWFNFIPKKVKDKLNSLQYKILKHSTQVYNSTSSNCTHIVARTPKLTDFIETNILKINIEYKKSDPTKRKIISNFEDMLAWLIRDTTCKMTSTMINTPLEKLNDQNYRSWKYNTKMMLIERELWKYVTEPTPDEEASRTIFNMKQEKALAMIALTISPSQQIHIMDCTTAREAWDTLEQVYEPKSRSRILQLKKQFISIRFEEETMTNYLGRLKICSDHLREAGAEMQDQDLAYSMLAGLPESYDGIIMTFSNVEDKEFTSSKVKHVLLAEYERRMARRVNNTNEALQFGTTTRKEDKKKKNFTCYKCGKEGHIARSCRGKAKTPAPNFQPPRCSTHEIAGSEMLTALSCAIPDNSWVIDSGATHHVCNKREWFTNFQGITSDPILTASGTTRAEGCGDIKFKAYVGKHHVDLKLCNVLYVPNVRRNLLSVSSMENNGKIVNFANRRAQVFDSENRIVAIAHDENGLYVMKGRVILPNAELFNSQKSSQKQTLELWHQRFCHVNNDAIERMAKGELVKGLEISSMDRSLCDDCCVAKSTKEPHKPIRNIRSKRPLELVHTDICGPMPVRSIGGNAYFLTFIDDYSRKITLFCLKHKNEVLKHFDSYLARAERETGHKLKVLRSDNGLEYCNHEFKTRLEQLGIKHELTNTYSPPMNGVAERVNRVLLDITRSCLHSADLPQRFWAEAVNTAAYIRNKCYNSALGDKVPDELWSSRKPSVRHLKAFGCLAYSHIPTERRKKLDNRANRCILVGYSSQTKGYRLWCPETQHVIQTKHVKFEESKIGLKWTKVEDEPERYNHIWIEPDNQLEGDIDLKPEAERERNDDTSDQDLVGVNNDDIVQTRPKRIVRNPYGRAGKPKAELHFLDIIEPTTFEQAVNSKEAPYWRRAMKDELRSLEDRNTWTLSDLPLGKRPISSRWVFKIKTNSKGDVERFKARLVARGFSQKRNVDFFETYSPVINFSVIRMIFALTINKNWYNRHLDVDNAYLYGELNEEIYMSPPDGSNDEKCEGKVLKLNRPIYGLRQSGLEWYCTLDKALEDIGFRRLAACNCLYTFEDKAVIAIYVDDLALFAESEDILTNIEEKIREKFKIKNLGPIKYFLGVEMLSR